MKLVMMLMLVVTATSAVAEPILDGAESSVPRVEVPTDKTIADTRVENTVENIYAEIKAGKNDRADLLFVAAKRGYSNACLYAGYMFDHSIAVQKNPEKAFAWFKSCATRNPVAAYDLAVLYAEGRGTTKNMELAVKWFKVSWPALKGLTPQTAVRLAYYYEHQKAWSDAWDWAEKASMYANNKKHGDYLMAKMLTYGYGQQVDISQALIRANNSVRAFNPNAATLVAWIFASGRTEATKEKSMEMACAYESIAGLMKSKDSFTTGNYCGGLDEDAKSRAEDFAKKWMADQKQPPVMDFSSTLDGKEPQFKF